MSIIRDAMPVLTRHEGDWLGIYRVLDLEGSVKDSHSSHLTCQFPTDGSCDYYQINRYEWVDGKREEHHFPGVYRDQKLWFDTDRIQGVAWEVDDATLILKFVYKTVADFYLYEMIQISPCNNYRARTWHWFRANQLFQRTLIQEQRSH